MRALGLALLLALALLIAFAALNWTALSAPTALSFGVATVQAPLGVILFGFALAFALVLLGYALAHRAGQALETRRQAQELRALRERVEGELAGLRKAIEESANGIAAAVGQVDDKLDRMRGPGGGT
jgi:uncharacterized integral membrane protein